MKSPWILRLLLAAMMLAACTTAGRLATPDGTPARAGAVADGSGSALDRVTQTYWEYQGWKEASIEANCDRRSISPELLRRYDAAVKAMDEAGFGYGRNSNFAAVQHPRTAYVECAEDK